MRSLVALLMVPLLAGCADPPADDLAPPEVASASLGVPAWQVGQYWSYDYGDGTFSLVVTDDAGGDYVVGTDDELFAYYEATTDYSLVGPIGKTHLDGAQFGQPVKYFDFPLEDGKTWRTTIDGEAVEVTANATDGGFRFSMRAGALERVTYTYSNETQWFDHVAFFDDNGTETFRMEIADRGLDFAGDVVSMDVEVLLDQEMTGTTSTSQGLDLPAEDDVDLYLESTFSCATGSVLFGIGRMDDGSAVTGDGGGYGQGGPCPDDDAFVGVIAEGPFEGQWGYSAISASPDFAWDFTLTLRTIQRVPIG